MPPPFAGNPKTASSELVAQTIESFDAMVLAGGEARRMGGLDKGLQVWQGKSLVAHALTVLNSQTTSPERILIGANRNLDQYREFGHALVSDMSPGFQGPLAGMQAGLGRCNAPCLLCIPCDMPALPANLASQLLLPVRAGAPAAYATTDEGPQPVCCLLRRDLYDSLTARLQTDQRRVVAWLHSIGAVAVQFPHSSDFANFNTLDALSAKSESKI